MLVIPDTQDAACSEEEEFKVILGFLLVKALTQNISKQRKMVSVRTVFLSQCLGSIPSTIINKQTKKVINM